MAKTFENAPLPPNELLSEVISGCERASELRDNIANLLNYQSLDAESRDQLLAKTKAYSGNEMEFYKRQEGKKS